MKKLIVTLATGFMVASAFAAVPEFAADGSHATLSMADFVKPEPTLGNDAWLVYQAMDVPVFEGLDGIQIKELNSKDGTFKLDCRLDSDQENAYCMFYLTPSAHLTVDPKEGEQKIHYEISASDDDSGLIAGMQGFVFQSFEHDTNISVTSDKLVIDYNEANRCAFGICDTGNPGQDPGQQPAPANGQ